jgi:hypothetical protein
MEQYVSRYFVQPSGDARLLMAYPEKINWSLLSDNLTPTIANC